MSCFSLSNKRAATRYRIDHHTWLVTTVLWLGMAFVPLSSVSLSRDLGVSLNLASLCLQGALDNCFINFFFPKGISASFPQSHFVFRSYVCVCVSVSHFCVSYHHNQPDSGLVGDCIYTLTMWFQVFLIDDAWNPTIYPAGPFPSVQKNF